MVATKRVPLAEVDNGKERRAAVATTIEGVGGGSVFQEPLGGFIFVCNNDTMGEDFERHLFGLPQRYQDSVKAIQPGLPLFLYNYTTRCLHGVFEASSDGGLNIEPDAWGENKESRKNGRQSISRFPAQVRVRWREERPPLDEEKFRPVLYHYDGPKFRLQLSKSEAQELLKLFGASPVRKMEEVQEDTGGEWEKVKTKSKGGRNVRPTLSKGPTSPNANGGRRRGTAQNSSSSNGGASLSGYNNFLHEAVGRGRERDNKIDSAQRWRNDSDSWSGSSSADTTSSKNGLHEEDRSKKLSDENGFTDISEGGSGFDRINGIASSKGVIIHTNGSNVETDQKVEVRLFDDDSNELNGFSVSPIEGANCNTRSGFVSYSAALRAGMLASAAAENGFGGSLTSAPADEADSMLVKTSQLNISTATHRNRTNSYSGAASAANVSPSSLTKTTKGDLSVDTVDGPSQKVGGLNKARLHAEGVASNHAKVGPVFGKENGKLETKADSLINGDASGIKPERTQAWGKPLTAKSFLPEFGSIQSAAVGDKQKATVKTSIDSSTLPKKLVKDVLKNVVSAGENGDSSVGNSRQGQPEAKDATVKPTDPVVRKNAWQGNDGAVLRLLHDPDPAVSSSSVSEGTTIQGAEQEAPKKQENDQKPIPLEVVVQSAVEKADSGGRQSPFSKQSPSSSGASLLNGSHSKPLTVDGPVFQPARTVHESRRQQFEKNQEERPHYRKQQGHPQEHLQHPPSMMHAPHQLGQGLMPLHIPTPSPSGMQQHHHHPMLSPTPQPLYRDRSRSRGSNGSGNGNVENVHNLAYRPISRNMLDGDMAMQNPMVQGSWGLQSPVLMMQPMPVTLSRFLAPSPQMLSNAEALHAEILEIARAATPLPETRVHAEAAVECVRSSVKQLWPEADVEVFGSFATGLCLHHSDVDVVVVDAPPPEEVLANPAYSGARLLTPLIRALAAALKDNEWCEGLNTIETASMPVIKLRCNPIAEGVPASPPVAIDITIGGKRSESFAGVPQVIVQKEGAASRPVNPRFEAARNAHNGAAAREFVIERLRQLPALAPLVLLLKSYLRTRNLNDVYSGGLGSFALTLMLVFYLERAPISCGTPQEIPRSSKASSPSPASGETRSQPNGEIPPANGEACSNDVTQASGETLPPASGETVSLENGETPPANGLSPPENGKTPANGVSSAPVNGDSSPENGETIALSVDISQASTATAESMDFSDDDSCASSQLTSTSVSSMASIDMTSLHGSSGAAEIVKTPTSSSNDEPLLRKAGNIVEELLGSMNSVTSPNLGTLLIGFLHFFGQEIDFSRVRLVLKGKNGNPGGLFVHEKNARTLPLWIDDPLRPDANIGAGSFNIWQVQSAMRDMLAVIAWPQSVGSNPMFDGERVGKGPGRRRHSSLLQPFLEMNTSP